MSDMGNDAVPPFQDPHNRCKCINSGMAAIGPKFAACFDGNCSANRSNYLPKGVLLVQQDTDGNCTGSACGVVQICTSDSCVNNASNIRAYCPDYGTDTTNEETDTTDGPDGTDIPDGTDDGVVQIGGGGPDPPASTTSTKNAIMNWFDVQSHGVQIGLVILLVLLVSLPPLMYFR